MAAQSSLTSLIVPVRTLAGRSAQIVVGLVDTEGGLQIAMWFGDEREAVVIPEMATSELIISVSQMLVVKQQRQGSRGMGGFSNSGAGGAFESVELVKRRAVEEES